MIILIYIDSYHILIKKLIKEYKSKEIDDNGYKL